MTMVVSDFFFVSPTILSLPEVPSLIMAAVITLACLVRFVVWKRELGK